MSQIIITELAAALVAVACLSSCTSSSEKIAEVAAFEDARAFVLQNLKEPDSASFGPFSHGASTFVCGSVNVRNSSGRFTGAQPFVFSASVPADDRLLIYDGSGNLGEKGVMAELFEHRGCRIGAEHDKALLARSAIKEKERREYEITDAVEPRALTP